MFIFSVMTHQDFNVMILKFFFYYSFSNDTSGCWCCGFNVLISVVNVVMLYFSVMTPPAVGVVVLMF